MPTKNVNLTADLIEFVTDEVAAGDYSNHSEVVRAALTLLRSRTLKRRALVAQLEISVAEFEAGKSVPLTRQLLRKIADDAKARAQKRRAIPA